MGPACSTSAVPIEETITKRATPRSRAAWMSLSAPPRSIVRLRSAPLPGPAPAANTIACAKPMCSVGSSDSRSQSTGSAPISSRSAAWSGLRIMPRPRWPFSESSRSSRIATCPCPPATRTSMERCPTRSRAGDSCGHEVGSTSAVTALELLAAFVLVIGGAVGFTNAVEWLGHRLNLAEGAVGALLAAVGTALPESVIPIVALAGGGGGEEATQIAIGAIIGAPFLLGTLAMLLVVGSAHLFASRREQGARVEAERDDVRRDLRWFLILFPPGIVLGVIGAPDGVRYAAAAVLLVGYGLYVRETLRAGGDAEEDEALSPLYFDTSREDPPNTLQIVLQFVVSLA